MTSNRSTREDPVDIHPNLRDLQKGPHTGSALVSVVIPCYNQAHFLGEAIESVFAQSYPNFELVVVDDGSTDNVAEVAARYPGVRYIRQENQGLAAARNSGLRESEGSYLVFLDADDRLLPEALALGLASLRDHPECAYVFGHYRYIGPDGSPLQREFQATPLYTDEDHYLALLRRNYIAMHATAMFRRSALESVGGFDITLKACEDYDLYFRLASRSSVARHNELVAEYRYHGANMHVSDPALMLRASLRVLHSQRPHIKGNKLYEKVYAAAVRDRKKSYGGLLARKILDRMQKREWKRAVGDLLILTRYYPAAFVRACTKLVGN